MRQNIRKLALVLGSFLIGILIMEFVVRTLDIPPKPLPQLPVHTYQLSKDPIIGYEYRPNHKPNEKPYDIAHQFFWINKDGFRDFEYKEIKPDDVKRIIFLGDSTTAGNGVPDMNKIYVKRLERLLNQDKNNDIKYEILNLAVGGYHTMQEVQTLKTKGLKYDPDIVFLTFCMNDFFLNNDGGVYNALSKGNYPKYLGPEQILSIILKNSRLAFVLYHRLQTQRSAYDRWYAKNVLKNKSTVEAGLTLLSELQQIHNFKAFVLILPSFSDPFQEYKFMDIHEKVLKSAQGLPGIKVVDLLKEFSYVNNNPEVFTTDGLHMNEYGDKIMSEILFPFVRALTKNS